MNLNLKRYTIGIISCFLFSCATNDKDSLHNGSQVQGNARYADTQQVNLPKQEEKGVIEALEKIKKQREEEETKKRELVEKEREFEKQLLAIPAIQGTDKSSKTIQFLTPIIVDNVKFIPINIELKKIKGIKESFGDKTEIETKEKILVLNCLVQNISEGQIFQPITKETLKISNVTDNYGNKISALSEGLFEFDKFEFEGRILTELKPQEYVRTIIMAEKPKIEKATKFTWRIFLVTSNEMYFNIFSPPNDKAIFLEFSKSDIQEK